jgi:error-prone DNA polymerase
MDKDDLDALGILKIDVLALGMLTCLRRGFDLLNGYYASVEHSPLQGEGRIAEGDPGGVTARPHTTASQHMLKRCHPHPAR